VSDLWHHRREKVITYSQYVAVASMPFSIVICHVALITFLLAWLFEKNLLQKLQSIKTNLQLISLSALAIVLLCGIIYSENTAQGWFAIEKKAFFFLLPFAFATTSIMSENLSKKLFSIFCWSCFAALLVCYFSAYQRMQLFHAGTIGPESINYLSASEFWKDQADVSKNWMFFSYVGLSSGVNMHPTYLALYSAFCCILLVHRNFQSELRLARQLANFLLIVFFSCSIIFLSARIILVLLIVFYTGALCYQMLSVKKKIRSVLMFVVLLGILICGILINPVTRYRQVDEIALNGFSVYPNKKYDNSTGIRASLWWLSAKAYLQSNLLFGSGTGDVENEVKKTGQAYGITNVLNSYNPHNEYLYILLSVGIVGLTFFLLYIGAGLVKAWKNRDIIFLSFLVLFGVVCITESALELQKGIVFFSIFFSLMSFQKKEHVESRTSLNLVSVAN
jgi:O-antigen ligase